MRPRSVAPYSRSLALSLIAIAGYSTVAQSAPRVQLSWSATSSSQTNLSAPTSARHLYLHALSGASNFKGAEFDLRWTPTGDVDAPCLVQSGYAFRTSTSTCTYLNRGISIPLISVDDPDRFHVAWSNTSVDTTCDHGVIADLTIEFEGCSDPTARFALCSVSLLDGDNVLHEVAPESLGVAATVNGGGSYTLLCDDSAGDSTCSTTVLTSRSS